MKDTDFLEVLKLI